MIHHAAVPVRLATAWHALYQLLYSTEATRGWLPWGGPDPLLCALFVVRGGHPSPSKVGVDQHPDAANVPNPQPVSGALRRYRAKSIVLVR